MSDLIDRQVAIDAILAVTGNSSVRELYEHVQEHGLSDMWSGGVNAAIDIIIAVPPVQPDLQPTCNLASNDCISRKEAIDAVKHAWAKGLEPTQYLEDLPSAQPEVIRCTECKHYREYDSEYVENAVVVQCMADRYPISETIPDGWFCAGAERKDDE